MTARETAPFETRRRRAIAPAHDAGEVSRSGIGLVGAFLEAEPPAPRCF